MIKSKGKFVYDKYGQKDTDSIYSHFVINKVEICIDRNHEQYLEQGRCYTEGTSL
jgi:hypothetical protein